MRAFPSAARLRMHEMKSLAQRAGWPNLKQLKFLFFQQAVVAQADS